MSPSEDHIDHQVLSKRFSKEIGVRQGKLPDSGINGKGDRVTDIRREREDHG